MGDRGSGQLGNESLASVPARNTRSNAAKRKVRAELADAVDTGSDTGPNPKLARNNRPAGQSGFATPQETIVVGRQVTFDLDPQDEPANAGDHHGESSSTPRQPVGRIPGSQSVPNLGDPHTFTQNTQTPSGPTNHAQAREPQRQHAQAQAQAQSTARQHSAHANGGANAGDGAVHTGSSGSDGGGPSPDPETWQLQLEVERTRRKKDLKRIRELEKEIEQQKAREQTLQSKLERERKQAQAQSTAREHSAHADGGANARDSAVHTGPSGYDGPLTSIKALVDQVVELKQELIEKRVAAEADQERIQELENEIEQQNAREWTLQSQLEREWEQREEAERELAAHRSVMMDEPSITVDDPVTADIRSRRSPLLNYITSPPRGRPTIEQVLDHNIFPFVDPLLSAPSSCECSVVMIKNIPFKTTQSEIVAFLGGKSDLIPDYLNPIHITTDPGIIKTMDAYAEFQTFQGAVAVVTKHAAARRKGCPSRLGDRPVEVEMSSQEDLMAAIFPRATGIKWENITPSLESPSPAMPWGRFKGFVSEEEMMMLVNHADLPHRLHYTRDCPQRPYEYMLSILNKMPWHMDEWITFRQRWCIFRAYFSLLTLLQHEVHNKNSTDQLNDRLLRRLYDTGMRCPGFTMVQKDDIAKVVRLSDDERRSYGLPFRPGSWIHLYGLAPKEGMPLDVVEYFIAIIREETTKEFNSLPPAERARLDRISRDSDKFFGYMWRELGREGGEPFDQTTLRQATEKEIDTIESILRRALA